jgi:hypothetical protein
MVKTFVIPNTFQNCFCEHLTMMTSSRKEMKMLRFVPKTVRTGRITYRSSCTLLFTIPSTYRNETEQTKLDGGYDLSRYMKKQAPCPSSCSTNYANVLRIYALERYCWPSSAVCLANGWKGLGAQEELKAHVLHWPTDLDFY